MQDNQGLGVLPVGSNAERVGNVIDMQGRLR